MCNDIFFESSHATSYCNLSCLSTHALFSWNLTPCLHYLQSYYGCDQCEKLFSSTSNLFNHMQTEHVRSSMHTCETCSTMFESKENLDSHNFFTHTIFIIIDLIRPQQHPFYNPNLRRRNPVRYLVHIVGRLPMTLV